MNRFVSGTLAFLTLALLLILPQAAHAAESYDNCTGFITSVPAQISTPGTWCLKKDLATAMTSGSAILIMTNNVTIDCNDFKLGGLAAGFGTIARGISGLNRHNAVVRHCNIRGFYVGVEFDYVIGLGASGGGGHVIEDNRFDYNTWAALWIQGDGSVVRRNRIFETGGSTVFPDAIGIRTNYSVDVLDNMVSGVRATSGGGGNAGGIALHDNSGGSVNGNTVRGLQQDGIGSGFEGAIGAINVFDSDRVVLRNNNVVGNATALSNGLGCVNGNDIAKDNVINGFAAGMDGCVDAGGNVIAP